MTRIVLVLVAVFALSLPATAQRRDEQEAPWTGLVERFFGCLEEARAEGTPRHACIGIHARRCLTWPEGQGTAGMERCWIHEHRAWDVLLNRFYRDRPEDPGGSALRDVQRAWLRYRDLKCAYIDIHVGGGSMARWMRQQCMAEETARRVIDLHVLR